MKPGKRVIAVDESPKRSDGSRLVCFVKFRGSRFVEDVKIERFDGSMDPTEFLRYQLNSWIEKDQISVIFVDGICLGDLNVMDIFKLSESTSLPVISITRNEPDKEGFRKALEATDTDPSTFEKYGTPQSIEVGPGTVYTHFSGVSEQELNDILGQTNLESSIPEALRVADKISSGIPAKW